MYVTYRVVPPSPYAVLPTVRSPDVELTSQNAVQLVGSDGSDTGSVSPGDGGGGRVQKRDPYRDVVWIKSGRFVRSLRY